MKGTLTVGGLEDEAREYGNQIARDMGLAPAGEGHTLNCWAVQTAWSAVALLVELDVLKDWDAVDVQTKIDVYAFQHDITAHASQLDDYLLVAMSSRSGVLPKGVLLRDHRRAGDSG